VIPPLRSVNHFLTIAVNHSCIDSTDEHISHVLLQRNADKDSNQISCN
jgi:hypothetical protein